MSLIEIFAIIVIHWIADFVLQTHWQATNKSTNNYALNHHIFTYTMVWFVLGTIWSISSNIYSNFTYLFDWWIVWKFSAITFVCHWITDYYTSRLNSKLWAKKDVHNFFVSVGFDQVLHYIQLFTTYYMLK